MLEPCRSISAKTAWKSDSWPRHTETTRPWKIWLKMPATLLHLQSSFPGSSRSTPPPISASIGGGVSSLLPPFLGKRTLGHCAHLLCCDTMAKIISCLSPCVSGVSSGSGLAAIFPSRRKGVRPVCLEASQPVKQWENLGSTKYLQALPPFF